MDRDLRRSAYISGFLHVALIVAAIVTLPITPLPSSQDADVDVDIIGLAPQKSPVKGTQAATAKADVVHKTDTDSQKAPKLTTTSAPPPPPPPPQKSNAPVADKQTAQAAPPPPPVPSTQPSVLPPPPPTPPQKHPSTTAQKDKDLTKPTSIKSATHQQHVVKAPQPLSQSVLNTLMNLKAQVKHQPPPTAVYNPDQNTAPDAGGSPNSTANSGLTGPDRAAIGNHVRPCWGIDGEAQNVQSFSVLLTVTTDSGGTVREAEVSSDNTGDMSNPLYFAFTQRAIAAVMNAQCATLPLPSNMLGQNQTFSFIFTP